MARLPFLNLEDLPPEDQEKVRARLGPNATANKPFSILLPSPEGFARYLSLSNYNRDGSTIDARTRELVILVVAREWKSDYIWGAHEAAAKRLGVDDTLIAAIREGNLSPTVFPKEAAYLAYAQQLVAHRKIDDATFEAMRKLIGARGLVDLTLIVSYYTMQPTPSPPLRSSADIKRPPQGSAAASPVSGRPFPF